jgi:hypothetical protein
MERDDADDLVAHGEYGVRVQRDGEGWLAVFVDLPGAHAFNFSLAELLTHDLVDVLSLFASDADRAVLQVELPAGFSVPATPGRHLPERIPDEVEVSEVDLDEEEFIFRGERLTEARAHEVAEEALRRVGRPPHRPDAPSAATRDEELADLLETDDSLIDESTVIVVPPVLRAGRGHAVHARASVTPLADRVAVGADERAAAEQRLLDAMAAARAAGHTWGDIANRLGVTRQAAHARYANRLPPSASA